jgi:aspartyl-tRNA(Asn)/glutamyl-tRNA(Gln) amidotransferase subunit A
VRLEEPRYAARLEPRVRGIRVGVLRRFLEEGIEPPVRSAFEAALQVLAGRGAELIELEVPELRYAAMTSLLTTAAEAAADHHRSLRERVGDYIKEVRWLLLPGLGITAGEYLTVQRARHRLREAVGRAFETVDLIASPTTSRVAPLISEGPRGNGDQPYRASHNQSNLLRFPSLLGLPAISLPCGFDLAGLPIGMQLIGRWFADQVALNAALAYEQATDWSAKRPPIE